MKKPRIRRIVRPIISPGTSELIREGKPISSGPPGTLLLLSGSGFGKDWSAAEVHFSERVLPAFPIPLFSDTQILASVPRGLSGRTSVFVAVQGRSSNAVEFRVTAPISAAAFPGQLLRRFLVALDALATITSAELVTLERSSPVREPLLPNLGNALLQARLELLQVDEMLGQFGDSDLSQGDEIVRMMGLIPIICDLMDEFRAGGPTTRTRDLQQVSQSQQIVGDGIIAVGDSFGGRLGVIGGFIKEFGRLYRTTGRATEMIIIKLAYANTKRQEREGGLLRKAIELKLDLIADVPGADAEIGALRDELEQLARDIEQQADAFERQAQAVQNQKPDAAAHLREDAAEFRKKAAELRKEKDQLGRLVQEGVTLTEIREKLDRAESKLDRGEGKLDRMESKTDRMEGKLDKAEVKLDHVEEKLDRSEIKEDRLESKLDRVEPKLDKLESKLDRIEGKEDRAEGKLDRLEGKADKAERKLDRLEGKADKSEQKLDKIEGKSDKAEKKLDKLEMKVDMIEPKLDKIEPKLDKLEPKLDKLEPKIDKLEPKLDRLEAKADLGKEFWQISPDVWRVTRAKRAGVRVDPRGGVVQRDWSFNVESIHVRAAGNIVKIIVDDVETDIAARGVTGPANVLVESGIVLVGASRSVLIEFDVPYSGPLEFNGEKPQAMRLCTLVTGSGASQVSPNPCRP
jgi:peptidoglycan hydrolase CwlO-like protein